jgi:phosphate transport system substrate-binding protein
VSPSVPAFAAAAATANWATAPNMAASMINTTGAANWPIVSATYILLPKNPQDAGRSLKVMQFLDWAFRNGGPAVDQLHYIMLPDAVRNLVRQRWCQVQSSGRPVWSGCH